MSSTGLLQQQQQQQQQQQSEPQSLLAETAPVDTGIEWLFITLIIVAIVLAVYAMVLASGCINHVPPTQKPTTTQGELVPMTVTRLTNDDNEQV
jgi:hypothetical protein